MTASVEVRDRFVTLNGLQVHYREWGAPEAPALLMLHGAASFARSWDAVAVTLADRWHIVAPDLRGHGESDWAATYALDRFVGDIEEFSAQLGLARFALVGHSLGGMIGLRVAARRPESVTRLVVGDIGPDAFTLPAVVEGIQVQLRAAAAEVFDDPEVPIRRALAAAAPTVPPDVVRARTAYNLAQGTDGRWRWRYDGGRYTATLALGRESEDAAWAALAQVRCPTLVLRGENSPVLSRESAERMVDVLADGRWKEVPAAGHSVPLENLAGYLSVITPFLLEQEA